MKKIILFKGGVETLEFFSKQLAIAFNEMGYHTFFFDIQNQFDSFNELICFCHKDEAVMITFNFIGLSGETIFNNNGKLFFDEYGIRCINIVVDHPFYYYKNFQTLPKDYIQFCIDKTHIKYMNRFHGNVKLGTFLPLAGTAYSVSGYNTDSSNNFVQRSIDIIFTGNYTPPSKFEPEITRLGDEYTRFYMDIIDDLTAHPWLTIDSAFETHITRDIPDISDKDLDLCMSNMIFIDLYIRFYMRGKIIKTLVDNGFKVDVFGSGLDLQHYEHPENLIIHGGVNSLTCLRRLTTAKISLNIMPWFKDGAHDRIFNAAMNGAVNLTDGSLYLHEIFDGKNALAFYELSDINKICDITDNLLSNSEKLKQMSENAIKITSGWHTWYQRAAILKQYI